jgi:hypothetical protein
MNRLMIMWVLALAVSMGSLAYAAREYTRARAQARAELAQLNLISPQAREVALLRASAPVWASRTPPETALAPAAAAVVAGCGLPASALANVAPQAPARVGEGQFAAMRQRATITLTNVTLPEVGRFLEAWRQAEPDWIVTGIELSPQQRGNATPGADLPLRAIITIEALFSDASTGRNQRRSGGLP